MKYIWEGKHEGAYAYRSVFYKPKLGGSVKNHIDMLIFHTAICAGASQISPDGRTETAFADFCSPRR